MVFKSITLAATLLILSTSVSAGIISVDWENSGDNLITQDTASGLEWLDLTETTLRNYNDISSQLNAGGEFEGWRYATVGEVISFFDSFGGDEVYYDGTWRTEINSLFDAIAPFWGDTGCAESGCPVSDGYSGFLTAENTGVNRHNVGQIMDYYGYTISQTADLVDLSYVSLQDTSAAGWIGHALVRETSVVPIPTAIWLFGSGLISLIGIARRKKS